MRRDIIATMDAYAAAHPTCHPSLLKARLQEEIAARFVPVLFPHSPFFFEMGMRTAENWGTPGAPARDAAPEALTKAFSSLRAVDFTDLPGNAVLDVQLPAATGMSSETLVATMRTFAALGGPTLQLNCVSADVLPVARPSSATPILPPSRPTSAAAGRAR